MLNGRDERTGHHSSDLTWLEPDHASTAAWSERNPEDHDRTLSANIRLSSPGPVAPTPMPATPAPAYPSATASSRAMTARSSPSTTPAVVPVRPRFFAVPGPAPGATASATASTSDRVAGAARVASV